MGFIESYKHLEKLCGEVLNDDRRISAYIDEMVNIPRGSRFVSGWEKDLKMLKHYRYIRNQISHEPNCTEENMCKSDDTVWLNNFYSRIMNKTDPLTLYTMATKPRPEQKPTKLYKSETYTKKKTETKSKKPLRTIAFIIFGICVLVFIVKIILIGK